MFPFVAGISAGASNTVNYLAGDTWRARASFTTFAADPNFGNWRTFVRGQGLFNSDYIYRRTSGPDEALPFDRTSFDAHPGELSITQVLAGDPFADDRSSRNGSSRPAHGLDEADDEVDVPPFMKR